MASAGEIPWYEMLSLRIAKVQSSAIVVALRKRSHWWNFPERSVVRRTDSLWERDSATHPDRSIVANLDLCRWIMEGGPLKV
jgi:hypothetical protein